MSPQSEILLVQVDTVLARRRIFYFFSFNIASTAQDFPTATASEILHLWAASLPGYSAEHSGESSLETTGSLVLLW